jgi:hypothetical protein
LAEQINGSAEFDEAGFDEAGSFDGVASFGEVVSGGTVCSLPASKRLSAGRPRGKPPGDG